MFIFILLKWYSHAFLFLMFTAGTCILSFVYSEFNVSQDSLMSPWMPHPNAWVPIWMVLLLSWIWDIRMLWWLLQPLNMYFMIDEWLGLSGDEKNVTFWVIVGSGKPVLGHKFVVYWAYLVFQLRMNDLSNRISGENHDVPDFIHTVFRLQQELNSSPFTSTLLKCLYFVSF